MRKQICLLLWLIYSGLCSVAWADEVKPLYKELFREKNAYGAITFYKIPDLRLNKLFIIKGQTAEEGLAAAFMVTVDDYDYLVTAKKVAGKMTFFKNSLQHPDIITYKLRNIASRELKRGCQIFCV